VRRALLQADRAFGALARAPGLVLIWWLATLPLLAAGYGLVSRALTHGLPSQANELLLLLLWSCLVVLAWSWQLLGFLHLHHRARASLRVQDAPPPTSLRHLVDLLPSYAVASAARLAATLLAIVPLGAALPLVRAVSSPWPVRAALGLRARPARLLPGLELVVIQLLSWLLLALLTGNLVVLAGWIIQGVFLEAASLLPRLSDGRLWAVAGLLALSIVEPWRVLALVAALGLDHPAPLAREPEPGATP
jgi:hypothetical protein